MTHKLNVITAQLLNLPNFSQCKFFRDFVCKTHGDKEGYNPSSYCNYQVCLDNIMEYDSADYGRDCNNDCQ